MTEYYSNREHFERPLPVATFNHEIKEFLTDITEATKVIKDEQVDHLYVQIGTAELGLEKSYSTFEKSSNRSVDMQTSAQKAHKDIMETIDSKFTLGMDKTFNNLNDVNGQNKQYKTQKMTYTKAYEGPGAGGSTYEEHYTLSQLLNYKTSPIKAAREVYNGKVSFVKERIKHQDQMTDEEIKAIKGKNVEELVELYFPSQIPDYNRLKATNWQENNKEWLGYVETGFKWTAAIVATVGTGGWGTAAAAYIIADGTYSAVTGKTMISGTRLTSEEQTWAMIETVATLGGAGMGKLGRIFEARKMTKLAAVANVASKSDEAADAAHVMYDVVTKDQSEAIGSVAQYALFKSAGAAVKSIRKSSISSADDVSLKTNLDNDVVDLSSSKSNNLTLKTGSDLSIPKTQNHVDVPASAKSHVDVLTSGVADAELAKVKHTADLNLSTKSIVNVPTSKTADNDLPTVKSHTDMNLSSKTVSNAATAAAVSGIKPGDVDMPKVKQVRADYNDYVAHKTSLGEEPLSMSDWKLKNNLSEQNFSNYREFSTKKIDDFKSNLKDVETKITVETRNAAGEIQRIQLKAVGVDETGKIRIQDYTTAKDGLSVKRQDILDNLSKYGGTIVGEGKGRFTGGTKIEPGTRIEIISHKTSDISIEHVSPEIKKATFAKFDELASREIEWNTAEKQASFKDTFDMYAERAVKEGAVPNKETFYKMYEARQYDYPDVYKDAIKQPYLEKGASSIVNGKSVKNFAFSEKGSSIGRTDNGIGQGNFATSIVEDSTLLYDKSGNLKSGHEIATVKGVNDNTYKSGIYQYEYSPELVRNMDKKGWIQFPNGDTPGSSSLNIPGAKTWAGSNINMSESELLMPTIDTTGHSYDDFLSAIKRQGYYEIENPLVYEPGTNKIEQVEGIFRINQWSN